MLPNNLINWKKQFLENAEIAMDLAGATKEHKEKIKELEKKVDEYAKTVGKLTVERDWTVEKLQSLDLSTKRKMAQVQASENDSKIAPSRKHKLLGISRSYKYYTPAVNLSKELIKQRIQEIALDEFTCTYGENKVHQQLLKEGFNVSLNTVSKYRRDMGIKAVIAVKPVTTTVSDDKHPKYPYLLKGVDIDKPNKVWSTDITYIKINGGMVYFLPI